MPQQNTSQLKQRIISIIQQRGPSLPSHISGKIEQSLLFTSAFLSELLSEKKIKITNMKVGNSPVYYLSGQEPQLENYSQYLKSKEKEAHDLLKEKKFLKDTEQDPAIRVALREIRDFAIPFRKGEEIFWRYYLSPESEFSQTQKKQENQKPKEESKKEVQEEKTEEKKENAKKKELDIFDKKEKKEKITRKKKKTASQKNDKFFNKIKEHLSKNDTDITDIIEVSKNSLTFKVKENDTEYLIIAYNKKRIAEEEINKAYKKSSEMNLPYKILSFGEPLKRVESIIEAVRNLKDIEKIE